MPTILFLSALLTFLTPTYAATVASIDYGMSKINYEPMSNYNVTPTGPSLGLSLGSRNGIIETELFYRSLNAESDFIHDNETGQIEHQHSVFGGALKVYLTKHLFLRFGYGFSNIKQSIKEPREDYRNKQIVSTYGMLEEASSNGPVYGLGYNFFDGKLFDVYASFERTHIYDQATEMRVAVGIKFYFKLGLRNVFTER